MASSILPLTTTSPQPPQGGSADEVSNRKPAVESDYDEPQGEDWYDKESITTFSITRPVVGFIVNVFEYYYS